MTDRRDYDVLTFGETMLRLAPPGFGRLEEATTLEVRIGGSESNTAVALARLGLKTAWTSKLPANPLGRRIENEIRRWGVDTSGVVWDERSDARAGLYFLDYGVAPRPTDVYYDRAASSVSRIRLSELDNGRVGKAKLLHLSGITPALSDPCAEATHFLMAQAKQMGTAVSFDINYRTKLWTPQEARTTLERLLPLCDVLLCPLSDAETVFGITGDGAHVARTLREWYRVEAAVVTCGGDGAVACDGKGEYRADAFPLGPVVDRVGAGDAFNAGVLMGWLQQDLAVGLRYGVAMAALKHTVPGDLLLATRAEIEHLLDGGSSAIQR